MHFKSVLKYKDRVSLSVAPLRSKSVNIRCPCWCGCDCVTLHSMNESVHKWK